MRPCTMACASCSTTCPRAAHLVIATRTEPPIGISRLRARAELDEIASEQLRFSDAEAAALLNDTLALALAAG